MPPDSEIQDLLLVYVSMSFEPLESCWSNLFSLQYVVGTKTGIDRSFYRITFLPAQSVPIDTCVHDSMHVKTRTGEQ